jgi:hypothetical protein
MLKILSSILDSTKKRKTTTTKSPEKTSHITGAPYNIINKKNKITKSSIYSHSY